MTEKKDRERVIAEITLSHLIRPGNEQGCPVSRQQALAFLNQQGRAFEMWKCMMQAAEVSSPAACASIPSPPEDTTGFASRPRPSGRSAPPRASDHPVFPLLPRVQEMSRQGRLSAAVAR